MFRIRLPASKAIDPEQHKGAEPHEYLLFASVCPLAASPNIMAKPLIGRPIHASLSEFRRSATAPPMAVKLERARLRAFAVSSAAAVLQRACAATGRPG